MADTKGYIKTSDEKGSINISQSVITTIAAAAAVDVDGVHGLYQSPRKELTDISAGGKKEISKGAKIAIEGDGVVAEIHLIAKVGYSVNEVAAGVQEAVISAIEEAVGAKVHTVNVHVCGVSMEKSQRRAKSKAKPEPASE